MYFSRKADENNNLKNFVSHPLSGDVGCHALTRLVFVFYLPAMEILRRKTLSRGIPSWVRRPVSLPLSVRSDVFTGPIGDFLFAKRLILISFRPFPTWVFPAQPRRGGTWQNFLNFFLATTSRNVLSSSKSRHNGPMEGRRVQYRLFANAGGSNRKTLKTKKQDCNAHEIKMS